MCGRYTLTNPDPARLGARFDVLESVEVADEPRFNIAPTDPVLAVRLRAAGGRELGRLRWGLVPGRWAEKSGRPLINARVEGLERQPAFAESFRERRCLIPADGFYEWLTDERGKRPVWVSRPDGGLFAFAGIWAELPRKGGGDDVLHSCAIVTCPPNDLIRPIHDRMPVVLEQGAEAAWLDPEGAVEDLTSVLVPAVADALTVREVPDLVNDVRNDGPELIGPREEQSALF